MQHDWLAGYLRLYNPNKEIPMNLLYTKANKLKKKLDVTSEEGDSSDETPSVPSKKRVVHNKQNQP